MNESWQRQRSQENMNETRRALDALSALLAELERTRGDDDA